MRKYVPFLAIPSVIASLSFGILTAIAIEDSNKVQALYFITLTVFMAVIAGILLDKPTRIESEMITATRLYILRQVKSKYEESIAMGDLFNISGLCIEITKQLKEMGFSPGMVYPYYTGAHNAIPLFSKKKAKQFGAVIRDIEGIGENAYWWPCDLQGFQQRIKYVEWMIMQYEHKLKSYETAKPTTHST